MQLFFENSNSYVDLNYLLSQQVHIMKIYKIRKNHLTIILLSFLFSCFSSPNEFIAPIYDLEVAFPITDTLITINDFIENDGNIVASDDQDRLGVLV